MRDTSDPIMYTKGICDYTIKIDDRHRIRIKKSLSTLFTSLFARLKILCSIFHETTSANPGYISFQTWADMLHASAYFIAIAYKIISLKLF